MNWNNTITTGLKISYPFIQAPMLVVTTPEMVAAASNCGCLGSLPLGYSGKENAVEKMRAVKKLTSKPFAVNLFAYELPEEPSGNYPFSLERLYEQYNLPFFEELPTADPYTYYTELIDVIVAEEVSVVSFHFGVPEPQVVERLHSKGIMTMATATCTKEAILIEQQGLDIVVAQGIEAGGNRGNFTKGVFPQIGLVSLVPQIVDAVKLPVVAAGGLTEDRGAAAAFTLGAQAVQLGSFFLRSAESGAPVSYKNAVAKSSDISTVLTRVWSGRYGRCIDNPTIQQIKENEIYPSPLQNYLTNKIRTQGRKEDNPDMQSLWAGQSARYAAEDTTSNLLKALIKETGLRLTHPPLRD